MFSEVNVILNFILWAFLIVLWWCCIFVQFYFDRDSFFTGHCLFILFIVVFFGSVHENATTYYGGLVPISSVIIFNIFYVAQYDILPRVMFYYPCVYFEEYELFVQYTFSLLPFYRAWRLYKRCWIWKKKRFIYWNWWLAHNFLVGYSHLY